MVYQIYTKHPRFLLTCILLLAAMLWLFHPSSSTATSPYRCKVSETHWSLCFPERLLSSRETYLGQRRSISTPPQFTIEPYVRPEVAAQMVELRSTILATAARHNQPRLSGMSNAEFAEVMAVLMYNERNGWLEDEVEVLRAITPFYEKLQVRVNESGIGSDFTVWPSNLRPSVALEILRGQIPVPAPTRMITVPLEVVGSRIRLTDYHSQPELFAALTYEISQERLAVEYLAANLERGVYRANFEGVPVNWRTLASWHNQGIVQPTQARANSKVNDYVRRTSAYLPAAHALIARKATNDSWGIVRKE